MTEPASESGTALATGRGLGRRLQLSHAVRWLKATAGDPHARVPLGFGDEPRPLFQPLRLRSPLWRSETRVCRSGPPVMSRMEVSCRYW